MVRERRSFAVDVIRPGYNGNRDLIVESALTSVTWSSPALNIRAIGPRSAGVNEAFNYRIEVTNPGDQIARNVVVRTKDLSRDVQFISSEPKPAEYGNQFEWNLGDIQPGSPAKQIDIQLRSAIQGEKELCFEVAANSDQIKTQACAITEIATACLDLRIDGPNKGQVGNSANFNIVVANTCNETLEDVQIQVQYDPGLNATGLANPITADIGTLRFGEKREVPLQFNLLQAGRRCFVLTVTARGGHTAEARQCIDVGDVVQPGLRVRVTENINAIAGQTFRQTIVVQNTGNVAVTNLSLLNKASSSIEVKRATRDTANVRQAFVGNDFGFMINRLEPGTQQVLDIEYEALQEDETRKAAGSSPTRQVSTKPNRRTFESKDRHWEAKATSEARPEATGSEFRVKRSAVWKFRFRV